MPKVTLLHDKKGLVKTSEFPDYAYWPFEDFNPPQSCVIDVFDKDTNIGIAAATSAGKTVMGEMYIAHEINITGKKAMYLGTHKALVQEKMNDWTDFDHHFSDRNISICSGDYQLTDARKKELAKAEIIVMTSEMLASRCRNFKSEKNNFLTELGVIVCDESHLLTVPGRGDHLEVALMKITEINPDIKIVMLSATMPNVVEVCEWLSYNLNGKDTYYLNSEYRPCPLDLHYPTYWDNYSRYDQKETSKVNAALDIVAEYPDDKFLIFAHTKRTGEQMKTALKKKGVVAEFHNANCSKAKRAQIEQDFCNPKKELRCVIATSTLAWGCNLPARRVIVLGVHRGLSEVETYDIAQMCGRAGRPKFDKKGDAYILLPQGNAESQRDRISNPVPITSQLLEHHKILAFHLVSEIYQQTVKTIDDMHKWYSRSLASYQSHDLTRRIDDTLESLSKCGAIAESDGQYEVTSVGKIASMFYFSPFDVADLKRNFNGLFKANAQDNDLWLSMAHGNTDSNRTNIVSRADKEAMDSYARKIAEMSRNRPKPFTAEAIKGGFAYYCLLTGSVPTALAAFTYGLKADFDRTVQVLNVLDSFSGQWEMKDWFDILSKRVMYGVKPELMPLIEIAEVGKVRAEKLHEKGIKTAADIIDDPQLARAVLNVKPNIFDKIHESAQALAWKAML